MSRFSRIFKQFMKRCILPSTLTIYSVSSMVNISSNDDEEECESVICHDANEAIREYSGFKRDRRGFIMGQPPDRQQLGRHSWTLLHTIAAYWPNNPTKEEKENIIKFLQLLSKLYPCHICAADLRYQLEKYPPMVNNRDEFIKWICDLHNRINKTLHKPIFNCNNYQKRWKRQHDHTWHDIQEIEENGPIQLDHDDNVDDDN